MSQNPDSISDGIYVASHPTIFEQNSFYKSKALDIVERYSDSLGKQPSVLKNITINDFANDIRYLIENPNRTLLNHIGNYCGSIVIINWLLNNRPDRYAQLVFELALHGYVKSSTNKKIKVPEKLQNLNFQKLDTLTQQRNLIDSVKISDFLLGVSMLYSKKKIQRMGIIWNKALYDKESKGNFIFGNSAPWEMNNYIKLAGLQVSKQRYYLRCRKNIKTVNFLKNQLANNALPIVFENHFLTASKPKNWLYRFTGAHFITIHGLEYYEEQARVDLSYWDYGKVSNVREIHPKHSPYSVKNFKKLIKKAEKYSYYEERGKMKNMSLNTFYKGIKGYWIIENIN